MPQQNQAVASTRVGTGTYARSAGHRPAPRSTLYTWISSSVAVLTILFVSPYLSASDCLPIDQAGQHIGETKCVTGKVLKVKLGVKGVHFLDFCEDQMACPFTVVVFPFDLKDVGDVRRLEGRTIEIHGSLKLYDNRPEIVLSRISQIRGGATLIPPLPKNYDVENRGHFSAGRLRPAKKPAKTKSKPSPITTYGNDVEGEDSQN